MTAPTVRMDDPVSKAVRLMIVYRLPGLVIVDDSDRPVAVLPGTQVLRLVLAGPGHHDAGGADDVHADLFWRGPRDLTVRDCLPDPAIKPATAAAEATLLEIVTVMADMRSPILALVDADGRLAGAVTPERLLTRLAVTEPGE